MSEFDIVAYGATYLLTQSHESRVYKRGFSRLHGFLDAEAATDLALAVGNGERPGYRGLLENCAHVRAFAYSERVVSEISKAGNMSAFPVRAFVLDKNANTNWALPWHQDCTIAVRARHDVPGFDGWSEKDGALHVRAPQSLLASMLSLRVALDDIGEDSGPLDFASGSHDQGIMSPSEIEEWTRYCAVESWLCEAGDAIVSRPLVLHRSGRATKMTGRRRILHIEYAGAELPSPLEWHPF